MRNFKNYIAKNPLFYLSTVILVAFSFFIFFFTKYFYALIEKGSIWVREIFGGFYLWLGLICVLFLLFIAFSKFGKIRLGNSPPEFNRLSWIAMLYSAGMGAGILLRAVQEPVFMYLNTPISTSGSNEVIALEYTFYQWGFTAWAFYGVFAIVIGYSIFVEKTDVRLSSGLGAFRKIKFLPQITDLLTILTTVFGLVAAVGLGTTQIEGGISHLSGNSPGNLMPIMGMVFLICLLAFVSAYAGVQKGIRIISNWNIYVTVVLMIFVLFLNDFSTILSNFLTSLYRYVVDFIPLSLAWGEYNPGKQFLTNWTYYYWAFWLAWAPFTGIFIARISKGRSLREMILGVLLIPSLGSFFWFSVFGTSAFQIVDGLETYNGEFGNVFTSMFVFFANLPFSQLTNIAVILLLISFLVTSVDSAIFVLSMFSDKGKEEPKKKFRLIWAILILFFSEAIIVLGNIKPESDVLSAMQKFLIISSLPFALFTGGMLILFLFNLYQKPQ
ncbi:BCCT family transporter [Autumnicola musiva]|uniref:BCCT family transporter n=1 Tax=Autumnicola musiva TaxID=3075589 RepID=A0ABU3D2D2_9FLAO|nr:BCCT family transporter [Zunongwangia sp. F117]MDT0675691.1 BCCT family transporter [Zunongwangia sp. F117]